MSRLSTKQRRARRWRRRFYVAAEKYRAFLAARALAPPVNGKQLVAYNMIQAKLYLEAGTLLRRGWS